MFLQAQEELDQPDGTLNKSSTSIMSIDQLINIKLQSLQSTPINAIPKHSSSPKAVEESNHKASMSSQKSSSLQVFPTGTTLTSVNGMPVLKRKRGRPPKNRSNEVCILIF